MFHTEVLRHLPLVSAGVWFAIVAIQVYRDRTHTWTEVFFLFACYFAGLYALNDWLLFIAQNDTSALVAAKLSVTSVVITELFFLLFTFVYLGRMKRVYWSFIVVTVLLVAFTWVALPRDVIRPDPSGLYLPVFLPLDFLFLLVYVVGYGGGGIRNLYRVYRIVRVQSRGLARRALGLVVTFTTVLFLGLGTNGYLGVAGNTSIPPPFSTLLIIVGTMTMYTLYPGGRERISEAIRKFRARGYELKAAYLVFQDGTLIGSFSKGPGTGIDTDLFSATLDVIQNFMRTSFPILRGTSLRTIEHGDLRIIIERGRYCYLTLVLSGEENDLLRRHMRDELLAFEARNSERLSTWRGVPADAKGTEEMFQRVFEGGEVLAEA